MPTSSDLARWMRRNLPTVIDASRTGSMLSSGSPTLACEPLTDRMRPQVRPASRTALWGIGPASTFRLHARAKFVSARFSPRAASSRTVTSHGRNSINQGAPRCRGRAQSFRNLNWSLTAERCSSPLRRLLGRVQRHGRLDERLEGLLIDLLALADVDRAPHVAFEARVEEAGGVLQRDAVGKRQLHDRLVGLAGADDAVVLPHRNAKHPVRRLSPFHLFDYVRVRLLDERTHPRERRAAPVGERRDPRVDQPGGSGCGFCFDGSNFALLHGGGCFFPLRLSPIII